VAPTDNPDGSPDDDTSASGGDASGPPANEQAGPGRRDRQRLELELDELRDTVTELRDELDTLRRERDTAATAEGGGDDQLSVTELRDWLYRPSEGDNDPGGDIVALHSITTDLSDALAGKKARTPVLPCWAEMDHETAQRAWEHLVDWLCGVLIVRYPASAKALRPCWFLHPELVENLTWLHNAWTLAYRDPDSPVSLAADWHLYWLPHVMGVAASATRQCYDRGVHDPNTDGDLTGDNVVGISGDLNTYIAADLRNRPAPGEQGRGYVVPPDPRPVQPWSAYRRHPAQTHKPGPGPNPPPGPPPGGPPPNPDDR
jgi:hypothetical protein